MKTPLGRLASLKVKLGALVGISVLVATIVATVGATSKVTPWLVIPVSVAVAMLLTQWLAAGMTAPLREMTTASRRMARGDYSTRIAVSGNDEVATLTRAFNSMARELHDVDQHRRDLVANVSHELRTPAAALRAVLENLADGVTPADEPALRSVLGQAERLSDLLADLLALSRLDSGLVPLNLVAVDVRDLVQQSVTDVNLTGRALRVDVRVEPPGLRAQVEPGRLRQAVTNLLDNAARHTPAGSTVHVSARREGESWVLDVADEGPGIAYADRERIFERFGTASAGGSGIGLAITRWVAEIHGGRVAAIDPGPNRPGARLRLTLPLEPPPRTRPGEHADRSGTTPQDAPALPSPAMPHHAIHTTPGAHQIPPATPSSTPHGSTPPPRLSEEPAPLGSADQPYPGARPAASQARDRQAGQAQRPDYRRMRPGEPAPPLIDGLFGSLWPERDVPGRPGLLAASAGVGLLAALVLPFRSLGIGSSIVILAAGATLAAAVRRRSALTGVCGLLGMGLALVPTLRAAEWLTPLVLLAGAVVVVIGITPATSVTSLIGSAAAWPLAGLRGLPWLGRMLARTGRPRQWWPVARTVVLSVLALGIFGALFASADALVASWVDALVPDLSVDSAILRAFLFCAIGGITLAGVYLASNPIADEKLTLPPGRPVTRAWEWAVPVGLVAAAYGLFIAAQATAWLAGHDYVEKTTGLTYADYVHQGFGQLTLATLLTLVVIGLAARKADLASPEGRLGFRVLVGVLGVLTLVVVASALGRMALYQQAYGYTTLRLTVDVFEAWVGLVVLLVLVAGIRLRARWVPRAAALSGAAMILALALLNPDAWVAGRNIDRYAATGKIDTAYLATLSADAMPTVAERLTGTRDRDCVLHGQRDYELSPPPDDILEWNLGRHRARGIAIPESVEAGGCSRESFAD